MPATLPSSSGRSRERTPASAAVRAAPTTSPLPAPGSPSTALRGRERAADRELADVLRPVAQIAPEHGGHDDGEEGARAGHRRAPADRGNRRERERDEEQLPGAEAGLDEAEREPAALREPVGDGDGGGDAGGAAEAERGDDAVGQRELPAATGTRR